MPAPPLGSDPAIVSAVLIRDTDHRIPDANDAGFENLHKHSSRVSKLFLQTCTDALHLQTGFARNGDGNPRGAEPELFALPQRHDVEPIDHRILVKLAGLEFELVQQLARQQQDLPPPGMPGMVIALESVGSDLYDLFEDRLASPL